jgi:hypothetical protein
MMVLHDFLSKRIALIQDRARSAWLYTDLNDTMRLEPDDISDLDPNVLAATLSKLSVDLNSHGFITPPELCAAIC